MSIRTLTERGAAPWSLFVIRLLAVLVPTALLLWFMTAAMRNERLGVRQKLADFYGARARAAENAAADYWAGVASALDEAAQLPPPEAFKRLVEKGMADSAIVFDASGVPLYPVLDAASPGAASLDSPQWRQAAALEYDDNRPADAAALYAEIARIADDENVRARALLARARCLVAAGKKQEALAILTDQLAADPLRRAVDGRGRLIAPNAMLFALQLIHNLQDPQYAALTQTLAALLNDYAFPMPSAQRRFLMRALQELPGGVAVFPTLAAEELAAQYLASPQSPPQSLLLTETLPSRLYQFASPDRKIVALFRGEALLSRLDSLAALADTSEGVRILLMSSPAPSSQEPFLTLPACAAMPGWRLEVTLLGANPFATAATRQIAVYLWTGFLGIFAIALLALVSARYVSRQMKFTRLKNDLIATVSHELKTPLASMRVLVDTLLEGRVTERSQVAEYYVLISRENERLTRLIDNFLAFSRMERKKLAFDFAPVNIGDVVAAAVNSLSDKFNQPGCRLDVDVAPGLPEVSADYDALVTVLLNLLDNAHKYTGDDKKISLRAYAAGEFVCLEVADNGIGLSRREKKRIFDRFYQADERLSRTAGGCGLGLSIVKFILDAHGATIDVQSEPHRGSTFTVKIPALVGSRGGSPKEDES